MSRNGSGTYFAPAGNPVVTGTVIQSATFNSTVTDIGNEITNSLARDGQAPMSAPLKLTDGTVTNPSLTFNSETSTGLFRPSTGIAALTVSGAEVLRIGNTGNLTFSGSNPRFIADYSNSTLLNRSLFQTSTANSNTSLGVIPSGSAVGSNITFYSTLDPTNAALLQVGVNSTAGFVSSGISGTGTYLPLQLNTGGAARVNIDTSGNTTPNVTNTQTLGSTTKLWSNVYATTFTGALAGNASTVSTLNAGQVGAATAAMANTDIGSYMFAINTSGTLIQWGGTIAGSSLRPANGSSTYNASMVPSGTWMACGYGSASDSTLWRRVS